MMKYSAGTYLGFGIPIGFFLGIFGGWQTVWFIWIASIIMAVIAYKEDRHRHGYTTIFDNNTIVLTDYELKTQYGFDQVTWLKEWELKKAMDNYKRLHNLFAQSNRNPDRFGDYLLQEKWSHKEDKVDVYVVNWEHEGTKCVRPYIYFAEEYENVDVWKLNHDESTSFYKRIDDLNINNEPYEIKQFGKNLFTYKIPNKEKGFVKIYI